MKKFQLLEKAMRDYPAGTHYMWKDGSIHLSSGVFCFRKESPNAIFDYHTDEVVCVDQCVWAEIIAEKSSLLAGKCAIQVNNEREFELLMAHYEKKGWKHDNNKIEYGFPQTWFYGENNGYSCKERSMMHSVESGYTIIPFADFAAEVGTTVPVFVLRSEDGVDLYEGDKLFEVTRAMGTYGEWYLVNARQIGHWIADRNKLNRWVDDPESSKAFSSREAAEAFIAANNKPKHVTIALFRHKDRKSAEITPDKITIRDGNDIYFLKPSDLEDVLQAYKSLQP